MALADSYKKRCWTCDERISMAFRFCPWCGDESRTATLADRLGARGTGQAYRGP